MYDRVVSFSLVWLSSVWLELVHLINWISKFELKSLSSLWLGWDYQSTERDIIKTTTDGQVSHLHNYMPGESFNLTFPGILVKLVNIICYLFLSGGREREREWSPGDYF